MQILVSPPTLAQQNVKVPPDFTVGSAGFSIDLSPLTDEAGFSFFCHILFIPFLIIFCLGRRFYYEPQDVHCDVTGGPPDPVPFPLFNSQFSPPLLYSSICLYWSFYLFVFCRITSRDRA
jgi:hypothetical protein